MYYIVKISPTDRVKLRKLFNFENKQKAKPLVRLVGLPSLAEVLDSNPIKSRIFLMTLEEMFLLSKTCKFYMQENSLPEDFLFYYTLNESIARYAKWQKRA